MQSVMSKMDQALRLGYSAAGVVEEVAPDVLDIKVGDLLFTALLVLAPCMVLGVLRPSRPWRWVAIVAVFVPVAELLGFLLLAEKPYRAQIYESLLAFLPGIAGAYGGAMMRRAIGNIFSGK